MKRSKILNTMNLVYYRLANNKWIKTNLPPEENEHIVDLYDFNKKSELIFVGVGIY